MDARRFHRYARDRAVRTFSPAAALAAMTLAAALCGCQVPWRGSTTQDPTVEAAAAAASKDAPHDPAKHPAATPGAPNDPKNPAVGGSASAAAGAGSLADDRWVQVVAAPGETVLGETAPAKFRWRHFGLEAWLARGSWQTELATALGSNQKIVATNAAIVLAREGAADSRLVPTLAAGVDDINLRMPLRFAAVEALAWNPTIEARGELERLADQQSEFLRTTPSAYTPDMHVQVLLSLIGSRALGEPSQENPRLVAALASPAVEVRRVALTAWLDPQRKDLPASALELRRDPDPRVRATALEVFAVQRPKPAETLLLAALDDTNLSVRIAAIGALGRFGSPAARLALEKLRSHSHEAARVAAVHALYKLVGYQSVVAAAHDKSWRVRQAVAESLSQAGQEGDQLSGETVALAQSLVHDPSLDVQRQMLQSLAAWPLTKAGPLLLSAMGEAGYQTRKDAAAMLASRWPAAGEFPVEAPTPERAAAVSALSARWTSEFPTASAGDLQAAGRGPDGHGPVAANPSPMDLARLLFSLNALRDTEIRAAVRQAAIDSLVAYGTGLPAALESPAIAEQGALPEVVYEEVLPKVSPVFAALDALGSGDVRLRRGGATQLSPALAGKPMSPLALDRLVVLARRENDPVVWQSVLGATAGDARAGAVQLAYLAVGNSSSDVRRRACDYLAAHADVRHAAVLLPMLEDPNSTVAIAAVRGLGAIGSMEDPQPLIGLLRSPDRDLRLEAASNLVRLKVEDGRAALQRMALDADLQVRLEVARRMGDLAEPAFLPMLIQMSAEPNDVGRVALTSLTKLTGQDFSRDSEGSIVPRDAQTAEWQGWYRRQQLAGVIPGASSKTASAATAKDQR